MIINLYYLASKKSPAELFAEIILLTNSKITYKQKRKHGLPTS
jgi:hypothetical protein